LERKSGLKGGTEFFVSVCPERTTEGNALVELKTLPQIVGGYDPTSCEISMRLFNENTHTVIDIGSLEAAELCKLMDNTYRDIRFAFSNHVAMLSEKLGLNLRTVVEKLNLAYKRNDIPYPSPGVGGACLSKDPYILRSSFESNGLDGEFISKAREINEAIPGRIVDRASKTLSKMRKSIDSSKIFVLGFAFKGYPETSDLRDSTTLWFLNELRERGVTDLWGYDPIVEQIEIEKMGVKYCSISNGFSGADAVFIMNNHRSFEKLNIRNLLEQMNKPALFFDAWQITPVSEASANPGITCYGVGTL
jgi:UDP-N-acetyl-D-mannosaminuronic acid dehydrogenase